MSRSKESERERRMRSLTHTLARVLRHQLNRDRGAFTVDEAVRIARVQLTRAGRPACRLNADARRAFEAELQGAAAECKDPTRPQELVRFARQCVAAAFAHQPKRQPLNTRVNSGESMESLVKAAIRTEYLGSNNDDQVVHRAVTRLIHERRRGQRGFARVPLDDGDVMRELLDLPSRGRVALPSADIRVHMARAVSPATGRGPRKRDNSVSHQVLGETLRHAALFSDAHLDQALGGEILLLGRPVGFADARRQTVFFEVRSAAAAHQLKLMEQDVVRRLRQVKGFEKVKALRTEVKGRTTGIVRTPRPPPPGAPAPEPARRVSESSLEDVIARLRQKSRE